MSEFFTNLMFNFLKQWERPADLPVKRRGTVGHLYHHPHEVAQLDAARQAQVDEMKRLRAAGEKVWLKRVAADSARPYYFNTVTQVSQWERPVEFGHRRGTTLEVFHPTPKGERVTTKTTKRVKRRGKRRVKKKIMVKKVVAVDGAAAAVETGGGGGGGGGGQRGVSGGADFSARSSGRKKLQRAVKKSIVVSAFARRWSIGHEDWEKRLDPKTHHFYYFNSKTGESRWHRPDSVPESEEAKFSAIEAMQRQLAMETASRAVVKELSAVAVLATGSSSNSSSNSSSSTATSTSTSTTTRSTSIDEQNLAQRASAVNIFLNRTTSRSTSTISSEDPLTTTTNMSDRKASQLELSSSETWMDAKVRLPI